MIFNFVRAFQIYLLKVLMHINGQKFNSLCLFLFQNTSMCSFIEKLNSKFIPRTTHTNQIKLSSHHYFDLLKQNID